MSYLTIHLDDIDNFVDHQDSSELTPKEIHEARSKLMAELDKDGDQFLIDLGLEDEVKKFRFIENSSCGSVHDHENGLFESFASTEDDEPCEALQLEVWVLSLSLPLQSIFNKITGKKYAHEIREARALLGDFFTLSDTTTGVVRHTVHGRPCWLRTPTT